MGNWCWGLLRFFFAFVLNTCFFVLLFSCGRARALSSFNLFLGAVVWFGCLSSTLACCAVQKTVCWASWCLYNYWEASGVHTRAASIWRCNLKVFWCLVCCTLHWQPVMCKAIHCFFSQFNLILCICRKSLAVSSSQRQSTSMTLLCFWYTWIHVEQTRVGPAAGHDGLLLQQKAAENSNPE